MTPNTRNNTFTPLINGEISNVRRVGHSITNVAKTTKQSVQNFFKKPSLGGAVDGGAAALNVGANVAQTIGMVGGIIAVSGEVGAAIAAGGFLAAMMGPQAAVVAGVAGLALLAKQAYSNREASHKELSKYVWNMVDTLPPQTGGGTYTADQLATASSAALDLLKDGDSQIKLMGQKHADADAKFKDFVRKIETILNGVRSAPRNAQAQKLATAKTEIQAMYAAGVKTGGALFEYVRRCSHSGNYMQAAHMLSLGMREKMEPGSVAGKPQRDFFAGSPWANAQRDSFEKLDKAFETLKVGPYI